MPIASVYKIDPVISVISRVPAQASTSETLILGDVAGIGGTGTIAPAPAPGTGTGTGSPGLVTFFRASYASSPAGSVVPTYPASVTLSANVVIKSAPVRQAMSATGEPAPRSRTAVQVTLTEDPGDTLGVMLGTDDIASWSGRTLILLGPPVPQGASFLIAAEIID